MLESKCRMRIFPAWAICFLLMSPHLFAQDTPEELRKIARNPFADVIKLPLEEDVNFSAGPFNRTANSLQLQPVLPFQISEGWLLIPRIVATGVAYQPDVTQRTAGVTGLGDTTSTFLLTPAHTGRLIWGAGPTLLLPTATSSELGSGKWGLGPTVVAVTEPKWGSVEMLVQNIWSIAGNSERASVNEMEVDLSFSYNLPHGWYLTSGPSITADWTQVRSERWLVPVGGGAGRSFNIGKQAVDTNLAVYYNVVRPEPSLLQAGKFPCSSHSCSRNPTIASRSSREFRSASALLAA